MKEFIHFINNLECKLTKVRRTQGACLLRGSKGRAVVDLRDRRISFILRKDNCAHLCERWTIFEKAIET